MDYAENEDSVVLEKIDNAVVSEDDFTEVVTAEFRDDSADAGILEKRFCEFDDAIDERDSVKDGIPGDEVFNVLKIVPCGQRPADLRHRAILSFSSSWVSTRPSATS